MRVSRHLRGRVAPAVIGALAIAVVGTAAASGRHGAALPFFAQQYSSAASLERIQEPSRHDAAWPKLDSRLAEAASGADLFSASGIDTIQPAGLFYAKDGRVRVVIVARQAVRAREAVKRLGGRVEASWRNLVQAFMPTAALPELSRQQSVSFVRPPLKWADESITGEEVAASLANAWQAKNFTGKGVKVGIIDGGFGGYTDRVAAGDLPANVVPADFCGGKLATADAEVHGTAVAEIVHEMAPDAQLFLICFDSEVTLAAAEAYAKAQGIQVINHSVGWFNAGRGDGSGPIGAIVQDAKNNGILWVNAAGNEGQTHWSGTFTSAPGDGRLAFAPGDVGNTFLFPGGGAVICGFLRWDEWPVARSDFDLYLVLDATNQVLAASAGDQNGTQPPTEEMCVQNNGSPILVFWGIFAYRLNGNPRLDLVSISPSLQYQTVAGSIGEPANSPAVFAAGALCWQSKALEPYSSQGPTIDGRVKPDIGGFDSVSGATYGPFGACGSAAGFAGTSAASPNVAGAVALVKQAFPSYTPDQLQQYLQQHGATDVAPAGADNATGAGMLQLSTPPDQVPPVSKALASSGKRGGIVPLKSEASDDEGQVKLREQVFRNGRLIATLQTPFRTAKTPRTITTGWKSPKKAKGKFKHCSRPTDKAGNVGPITCAQVELH
jgi:subtilisin family serine protease